MARSGSASFAKRQREKAKKDKRDAKRELRAQRRAEKVPRPDPGADGEDPDLIGIRAGPQPERRD